MPRAIEALSKRPGRPPKYDWDAILGTADEPQDTVLAYDHGADYTAKDTSFMNRVREVADERGLEVSLRNPSEGTVEIEVVGLATDDDDSEDAQEA